MKVYNSYSKKLEEFTVENNTVRMYNCGPTVYDYAHLGNFRSFLFADLIRRYLEFKGYEVKQVMNFTDVGHMSQDDLEPSREGENLDKMALAAKRTGITDPQALADKYIDCFMEDSKILNALEPWKRPRASEHVAEMVEIIKTLVANGNAYEVDGFVYFDQSSFESYGKLSGNSVEDLVEGQRVEIDKRKKSAADFALWKCDDKHIMKWPSPWSTGFPGWHIECSAMAMKYLGETLDIHTGGEDNIFPHHEAEIAQSECATHKTFARYWLHARHLLVDGGKMSKSKGNFFTVRELIAKGYSGSEIRYALISTHYRQNMNFTTGVKDGNYQNIEKIEALEEAKTNIRRMKDFIAAMEQIESTCKQGINSLIEKTLADFSAAMDDDLNISGGLSAMYQFIREVNKLRDKEQLGREDAQQAIDTIKKIDSVLGVLCDEEQQVSEDILQLVKERDEARLNKNFPRADEIRDTLIEMGYVLEDSSKGTICKKI
ncbi:cysteine--tRNA ligase [Candidatus Uabimicrobium sp. HlEnr_7]|uniref:cysteine--tRNA ligase n=1 Tax=Candidatus Uabimicrobium helgolandensis TaxID=3095367 RepID=UPI0035587837